MLSTILLASSVVLLSIDGLKPDYVLAADAHGLKVPNLRRLVEEGAFARSVSGVYPTVTYPSHATMLTGVSPARHGIYSNHPFDPFGKNQDGWYWYVEDLHSETLWDAARKAGLVAASVDWPVSVGAPVDYDIVQYWRAGNGEDRKVIRALSTPGLLREAETAVGPFPDGNDYTLEGDRRRADFIDFVLREKKPAFLTAYFGGLDTEEHESTPYSKKTFEVLEGLDELVGKVRARADVLCVVSDHGFLRSDKELDVNAALREAGLLDVDDRGELKDWRAIAWDQGGSSIIVLRDPSDAGTRTAVAQVLATLSEAPGSGIYRVLQGEEARRLGGYPDAAFIVGLARGFRTGSSLSGPVTRSASPGGTHGYLPEMEEMDSSFFLAGVGIPRGLDLGRVDLRDIAPTLAAILGLSLSRAEGRNLLEHHAQDRDPEVHRR
jgi:predicted AlkP superfamily pyrophosphatase or phosphodiesterase